MCSDRDELGPRSELPSLAAIVHVELAARAVAGGGRARADAAAARVARGARVARPRPAAGRIAGAARAAARHARRTEARQARALHGPGTLLTTVAGPLFVDAVLVNRRRLVSVCPVPRPTKSRR